ncbi:MAG: hypothetical protein JKY56_24410 [Kofleriaceae bacterium]|nr:hypothetical protein [Kofleriaceae bacterium]
MRYRALAALLLLASCRAEAGNKATGAIAGTYQEMPWTDSWLEGEAERYLRDSDFRRQVMKDSLTNKENFYAQSRLRSYGLVDRGWDKLPAWNPRIQRIDTLFVDGLIAGKPVELSQAKPLWDGTIPTKLSAWVALGRRVFFEYPLRAEVFAEHGLRSSERSKRLGLFANQKGIWPGVIAFEDFEGKPALGITCALCHVAEKDGKMVVGQARRQLDYGEMRLTYFRDTGIFVSEDLKRRMAGWGPGRADITQDDDEDPVAIVDLWGIRDHEYLTQSGTIRHVHPAALAIRQETQFMHASEEMVRPPRPLAWALAMYLYSIEPPPAKTSHDPNSLGSGHRLFDKHCNHCHSDANFAGKPVSAVSIGTDMALAGGQARGTGLYRPSPLTRVGDAAPYFHDGTVESLESLLDENRDVPGHLYGVDLGAKEKRDLLVFLRSL